MSFLDDILDSNELIALASIIRVGDAAYRELMEEQEARFNHSYLADIKSRLKTKLVQIECEIESRDPDFPFGFTQKYFSFKQCIPELHTDNLILHIGRSISPDTLPYKATYKQVLSFNNEPLERQCMIDFDNIPHLKFEPFYGIVTFGGGENLFMKVLFPSPGYKSIANKLDIPNVMAIPQSESVETFQRKKAALKYEFWRSVKEEGIS